MAELELRGASIRQRAFAAKPVGRAWWWARLAIAVVVPLVLAGGLLTTNRKSHFICDVCYSSRAVSVTGFGTDPQRPWLVRESLEDFRPSAAYVEFFDGACAHRWSHFNTSSSVFFLVVMSPAVIHPHPLARLYDVDTRFRSHVAKRTAAGALDRADFRAACEIPEKPTPADLADPGRRRLVGIGLELLNDVSERTFSVLWTRALESERHPPGPAPCPGPR